MSVELDPGEAVLVELSATRGVMKVRIQYKAYLTGQTAVYYDPKLNGGDGGWWHQPGSSNDPLIAGLPWEGGRTNAILAWIPGIPLEASEIGGYPDVHSPWSLLDASGGMQEWTEEFGNIAHNQRIAKGSSFFSDEFSYQWEDGILTLSPGFVWGTNTQGLRLASSIPGPGSVWLFGLGLWVFLSGRKRRCEQRTVLRWCWDASQRPSRRLAGSFDRRHGNRA